MDKMLALKIIVTIIDLLLIFIFVVCPTLESNKCTEYDRKILSILSIFIGLNAVSMWL